ncbi:MAG TPA: hypothetical protein VNW30_00710 [Opitutaceae bacterium]|nr:hypothetical protein [Opitutaceae bacterium]
MARHKSLRLTDWTYTDTTKLPLKNGIESLAQIAALANPRHSPCFSGQNGVFRSNGGPAKKFAAEIPTAELADLDEDYLELAGVGRAGQNSDLMPGVGVEPTLL